MSIKYIVVLNTKNPNKTYLMTGRDFIPDVFLSAEDASKAARKVCKHFKVVAI